MYAGGCRRVQVDDLPEIAVPRSECIACDWASDHRPDDEQGG